MQFSKNTLELLKQAGWTTDYHCRIPGIINPFDDFMVKNPIEVVSFLEKFGGLTIGKHAKRESFSAFPFSFFKMPEQMIFPISLLALSMIRH